MKKWILGVFGLFLASTSAFARTPRTISVDENEVAIIHTEIGYSTILQFDGKPTSAVLGDQDAFKVEYVGNALTIKPVLPSSKTNLFVFTDYDRFNFKLETTRGADIDYLVRVKRKKSAQELANGFEMTVPVANGPKMAVRSLNVSGRGQGVSLKVTQSAYSSQDGVYVVSFTLGSSGKAVIPFEPGDIELFQLKKAIPIENLYLEGLVLVPGKAIRGKLLLRESEFDVEKRVDFQFSPSALSGKGKKIPRLSFILKTPKK